jgi:transcriptional regulator with PAS, ATPase and Fis domain
MAVNDLQKIKTQFGIIGNSESLNKAIEIATVVAPTMLSVLITGENGSGKESIAKIVHTLSKCKHGNFISINCGAIPEGTIDAELFGNEKGAFTGAVATRKGYFEEANNGTIFLDEIGEMPLNTQTKLLRVLENNEIIKVGSSKVQKVNVRIVAATNVNLLQAIQKGKFREDLYYRINTIPIIIPPLRERQDDILLLAKKFSNDYAIVYNRKPISFDSEASEVLKHYSFPGNVRQLKNIIFQISALEKNDLINKKTIEKYLPTQQLVKVCCNEEDDKKNNYLVELEFLYKMLLESKTEISNIKNLLTHMLQEFPMNEKLLAAYTNLLSPNYDPTKNSQTVKHLLKNHDNKLK